MLLAMSISSFANKNSENLGVVLDAKAYINLDLDMNLISVKSTMVTSSVKNVLTNIELAELILKPDMPIKPKRAISDFYVKSLFS